MTETPEGSTEIGFMEKPGSEPGTPGLQGLVLIHYTTGAGIFYRLKDFRNAPLIAKMLIYCQNIIF